MSGADNVVWLGTPAFPEAARTALADTRLRANLRRATGTIRDKRLGVTSELEDWEELRERAAAVKRHTLRHLDHHLLRLEEAVTAAGGVVHCAADAAGANRIVTALVKQTGEDEVVKAKSMATQEIGLNEALADAGIRAYETDLAELIVQLDGDRPSHILVPAIHRGRSEIREIFRQEMRKWGRPAPDELTDDPRDLAEAARLHLREKFLRAKVAVSGANFAAADTGTVVVVESEGNGRMCLTLPDTLITFMGIEKVLPSFADLDVFLRLLPRSSTGERMNPYTSLWTGVTEGDGPQTFHLILLDNGRTAPLADEVGRRALSCIRCSACLNVCPVYERTGGHAYGSVYPGPIGVVLTPQLVGVENAASLLCGACYDARPVEIDIPEVLVHLRAEAVEAKRRARLLPTTEALAMKAAGAVLSSPGRLAAAQRVAALRARLVGPQRPDRRPARPAGPLARWSATRDTPAPPRESLRAWWRRTRPRVREDSRTTAGGKECR
ncbi:lactate utilization protein B [Streptomyces sp. NBC_00366]|uniref:lactate utilization protein B n=1 Tax=Streptomyces sp. NBC_00366 TaxID=2975727 RepID=UPI002E26BD1D